MSSASRPIGLSFSLAASAVAHGLLLVLAAWLMVVLPSTGTPAGKDGKNAAGLSVSVDGEGEDDAGEATEAEDEEEPEVAVSFLNLELPELPPETVLPESQPAAPRAPAKRLVLAPSNHAVRDPQQRDTAFVSSQNMRAASLREATSGADPRVGSREGLDERRLSLANSAFSEGNEPQPPPAPARSAQEPSVLLTPPDPVTAPVESSPPPPQTAAAPAAGQRPPESQTPVTADPLGPATGETPPDRPDQPPAKDTAAREVQKTPEEESKEPRMRETVLKPVNAAVQKPKPRAVPVDPVQSPRQADGRSRTMSAVRTRAAGGATERGADSVDALDTPEGRYFKAVHDVINPLWNRKLSTVRGLTGTGVVEVSFEIDARGKVSNVRLVDPGKANPVLEDVCLTSIISARLPRPPEVFQGELKDPLSNGKIRHSVSFYKY